MEIRPVIDQIIMLFLLIGTGLLLRLGKIFNDGVIKGVNALIMMVTWPVLMISTTQRDYSPETLAIFAWVFFGSILILALGLLIMFLVFRKTNRDAAPVMAMLCIMPNAGFFGIPIIQAIYGDIGLLYLSGYIVGFNIALWTVGVTMYTGFNLKALRNLLNPGIVCAFIGIALFLLRIRLPGPLLGTIDQLAGMNTPLSMLILGARMDELRPAHLRDGRMWLAITVKLIAFPLVALALFGAVGATGMALMILVASSAMPPAAAAQMMTERYGGDVLLSAKGTSVGTLCSMATLPLMLLLASHFA